MKLPPLVYPPGATPLDPDEIEGLIPSHVRTQGALNEAEQSNILDALKWIGRRRKNIMSDAFIRTLHTKMFGDVWKWAGHYRTSDKNIGVHWPEIAVQIRELCNDANVWIQHQTFDWTELGARLHHRLVFIHPFPNGNGRHARMFTDVVLRAYHQAPFTWGSTTHAGALTSASSIRHEYILSLRAADLHDYAPIIRFVRS